MPSLSASRRHERSFARTIHPLEWRNVCLSSWIPGVLVQVPECVCIDRRRGDWPQHDPGSDPVIVKRSPDLVSVKDILFKNAVVPEIILMEIREAIRLPVVCRLSCHRIDE